MKKVAIGCPTRNRSWVLPYYLDALNTINYPEKQYIFLDDNSNDTTDMILKCFYKITSRVTLWLNRHICQVPGHRRGEYNTDGYAHVAEIRNTFIDMFLATDADYLFSVDSDVIVPPDILQKLLPLANDKTIVAAAISNIPDMPLNGRVPGNFMIERDSLIIHPPQYPLQGVMEVDVTGASYLIPRAVLEAGIRYAPHPQGEDIPFCLAAKAAGYRLLVSFDVRPEHRMVEQ